MSTQKHSANMLSGLRACGQSTRNWTWVIGVINPSNDVGTAMNYLQLSRAGTVEPYLRWGQGRRRALMGAAPAASGVYAEPSR